MKPYTKAEPRFDIDLEYGQRGESRIKKFLKGIIDGNGQVEVKTKKYLDLDVYVETDCDKGRSGIFQPSGISTTTADTWVFNVAETGISFIIPTRHLRAALDDQGGTYRVVEERHGSCPTRGRLINVATLIYRLKQYDAQEELQPEPVAAPVVVLASCKHKPQFIENGRCRICAAMRRSA